MRSSVASLQSRGWVFPLLIAALIALLPFLGISTVLQRELMLAALYGLLVAGFNLSFGYGGQLALGQVAVFAGGAYTTAILFDHGVNELAVAIVASMAVAAVLGLVTGLPGLRFSSWALALVSFFLVLILPDVISVFDSQTGGGNGIPGILDPKLLGFELSADGLFVATIVASAICLLLLRNLVESRYGHGLLVLKQGAPLACSLGLSPFRMRLSAYVLAGVPAGLAGAFYAYYAGFVTPTEFTFHLVTLLLAAAVIAGVNSMWAAPLAAAILVIGPEQASAFEEYSLLAYGVILMLVGVGFSAGLSGLGRDLLARVLGRGGIGSVTEPAATGGQVADAPIDGAAAAASPDELAIAGRDLVTTDVAKTFDGVKALDGVDFEAQPGAITAIIGANGAGKTTLLNAISGHIAADRGEVRLGDTIVSRLRPEQVAKAGVARTFQTPEIPESLSVLDIAASSRIGERWIPAAAIALRLPSYLSTRRDDRARGLAALEFVGLAEMAHLPARELPLGQRRILEVARAIAAESSLILLDEPAAGLDADALTSLKSVLARMRQAGATVVLIEHNVTFVMETADTVYVMDLGKVIASGPPDEIRRDKQVIASYLGRRGSAHHTLDEGSAIEVTDAS